MNKQFTWKTTLVAAVLVIAAWSVYTYGIKLGLDLKGGTSFLLKMDVSGIDPAGRATAVSQAIEILRKRIDQLGVSEPILQRVGEDRILVELPGLKEADREEARRRIEKTAFLEFRLVHADNAELVAAAASDPRFVPPPGYQKMVEKETENGREVSNIYFVKIRPEMTGKYVKRAYVQYDAMTGAPQVGMEFDAEGAKIFERITSANVGRELAIVLDGELYSAPRINEAIGGGRCQISRSGGFPIEEAQQLASVLENPLQAPVHVMETRSVDPTLGKDSIASGVRAAEIGAGAVILFMGLYYQAAGLVADLALLMNILITVGVLAMFGFTLTLPGIAGVVLTIGMAVDTNVLIYERIREEMAANKGLRAALAAGYSRAFRVIFDAHFTAILTGVILVSMGSGPVKGFGVTLIIGLLANLFSGVFVTRLIFDWLVMKGWIKSFQMLHVFRGLPHINFLGVWKIAFALSWALILTGMVMFFHRGGGDVGAGEVYGIDFKGGDTATLGFAQYVDAMDIRHTLDQNGFGESIIQYEHDMTGGGQVLSLRLPEGDTDKVVKLLQATYPQAQFHTLSHEQVGAVVGKELLKQALWAVAWSLIAIMLYIAFRFGELSYGLGALISLIHDVLMTVGLFCLWPWPERTFSMPVVAAVLTLIGYSINDTIVVFDRIRENRKLTGGRLNYFDLINRSVNETLSRTILTAGTVFLCSVALYGFGGRVLNDFAFCFVVGVLTGTYSSIYIASPVVLWFHRAEAAKAAKAVAKKPQPAKA
ncbi:MAG TPA: protein translocase subunit SecD [Verrucomicrobiae bacterium]|nr:protein translocase subunit SecD [Verrucomicrobiae bacterium]